MRLPLSVLLVENSERDASLVLEALRWDNYEPQHERVQTAPQMAAALAAKEWDIIFCDYSTPGFDAPAALQLLKEGGWEVPLIVVSNTLGEETAIAAMKLGAADYVIKDRLTRLGLAVGQALEQSRLNREQKRVTEAWMKEQTLFNTLVDTIPDQIYFKDRESRFIRINEVMAQRFELRSPSDAIGKTDRDFFAKEHALQAWDDEQRIMSTGDRMLDLEEKETWPDGRETWVASTKVPMRDSDGKITGLVGISRDITERKRLEEQLRQSQKMEAIGQLSGGVAHDFNNLLCVIKGYIGLLRIKNQINPDMIDSIRQIDQAADRASTLTRQLLTFSRQQVMEQASYNLNGLVSNLTKMLRRLLTENIDMAVNLAPDVLMVLGDEGMIEQVLLNLVINARDAMPDGGPLLVITELVVLDEAAIKLIGKSRPGAFACLTIADSGNGISPEVLPRIFEPFFTTKALGTGTGLGLATVYSIMQQHGGWISVESRVGFGTTFRAFFPRLDVAAVPPAAVNLPAMVRGGHEGILLVEDDAGVREIAEAVLGGLGYRVFSAPDGIVAYRTWQAHKQTIELLVTDLIMPDGVTGRELAVRLREEDSKLPIIYMSGYSNEVARSEFEMKEGINYLCKPFDLTSLAKIVRASLDRGATLTPFERPDRGSVGLSE